MDAGSLSAPLACVVINPSKRRATSIDRDTVGGELRRAGYRGPVWLETTATETGAIQARLAVASGARLVVAAGGDGTVRSVAAGLAGTGAEMGILPLGTANLAARNLGLPVGDLPAALRLVTHGRPQATDLAWVSTDSAEEATTHPVPHPPGAPSLPGIRSGTHTPAPAGSGGALSALTSRRRSAEEAAQATGSGTTGAAGTARGLGRPGRTAFLSGAETPGRGAGQPAPPPGGWARPTLGREHACLVVAGIGFDAGLVASTRPALKARIGWGAYALAAMENLRFPRMDMVLSLDESPAVPPPQALEAAEASTPQARARPAAATARRRVERFTVRTLLIANGGILPAGITLLRGTQPDDGVLDVAAIDTVGGVVGWSSLARQVLPPRAATYADPARATGRVVRRQGGDVVVQVASPVLVEVDGDLLPPARGVHVRLEHGAVRIRRP